MTGGYATRTDRSAIDLAGVLVLVSLATIVSLLPETRGGPLQFVLGLPLAVFVPGYALVSAVFPRRSGTDRPSPGSWGDSAPGSWSGPAGGERTRSWLSPDAPAGIRPLERVALSVLLSVVVVAVVALAAALAPVGITPEATVAGVAAVTVPATAVAASRRRRLPPDERFGVPVAGWFGGRWSSGSTSLRGAILVLVVLASLLIATVAVGYATTQSDGGVEFYLLADGGDGEGLVAGEYPEELEPRESASIVAAVENHEPSATDYEVVVTLEHLEGDAENDSAEPVELDRSQRTVDPDERWTEVITVPPEHVTGDLRLEFSLYEGTAPDDPASEEPLRDLQLTVEVDD